MPIAREVWVVGRWPAAAGNWQFQGVFATEEEAVAACRDHLYFVGPIVMGEVLPHQKSDWPGLYYPID